MCCSRHTLVRPLNSIDRRVTESILQLIDLRSHCVFSCLMSLCKEFLNQHRIAPVQGLDLNGRVGLSLDGRIWV